MCFIYPCIKKAFARWYYDETGFVGLLCQDHLNTWLDNADATDDLEPTRLEFLKD